jgi:hypothetical protein
MDEGGKRAVTPRAPPAHFPLVFGVTQHRRHDGTAPADPLIRHECLAPAPQLPHGPPPATASDQPAALQVRPPALGPPGGHDGALGGACRAAIARAPPQDLGRRLPGARHDPAEGGVARPGVSLEPVEIPDDTGPERVELEIPQKFQAGRFLSHPDRLLAILEEVADPCVPPSDGPRVAGEAGP